MKLLTLLSFVAGSTAFVPSTSSRASTSLAGAASRQFENEIGVQTPLGLFDPFHVLDGKSKAQFDRLRGQEIKHGRVAMLAVVGYLVTYAGIRLPGLESVPSGLDALDALPQEVVGQMGATLILMEIANRDQTGKAEFPGDFRNGALDFGWDKQSDAWKTKKRSIELNQGRAAMMGIFGLMVSWNVFGTDWQSFYRVSSYVSYCRFISLH